MARRRKKRRDVYAEITERVVEYLERGVVPWRQLWVGDGKSIETPYNGKTGRKYSGINVLMLWMTAMERGYEDPRWMTFNQIRDMGLRLKPGQNKTSGQGGTQVVFWKVMGKRSGGGGGKEGEDSYVVARSYNLFNGSQVEGMPPVESEEELPGTEPGEVVQGVMAVVEKAGVQVKISEQSRALYRPSQDVVLMPAVERFESEEAYCAVLLHEVAHWTGHKERLNREQDGNPNSKKYAFEELVAEMGSAFLCAQLAVAAEIEQSAAYIASWIKMLKEDKRVLFRAASQARKACEWVLSVGNEGESTEKEEEAA